jgi:hypothetical protein
MLIDLLGDLNWLAVVVATLAWFVFAAIWYSVPPISKAWQSSARITPPPGAGGMPPPSTMILTLIAYFVTTILIALLVAALGITEVGNAIELGVLLGVGFGTVGPFISQIYEQKGGSYWLINGVASIVSFSIVAVILALWD